jgi:hypothetical protein
MTPRTKSSVILILAALVILAAAAAWGAVFAFLEPDASPQRAAQMQLHARASGWVMLGAIAMLMLALGRLLWYRKRAR